MWAAMWAFVQSVVRTYNANHVSFFAAALAYFAVFSLTPLLFLLVGVFGFVLAGNPQFSQAVQGELVHLTELLFPTQPDMGEQIVGFLRKGAVPLTSISLLVLLWTSSGFFTALSYALTVIFQRRQVAAPSEPPTHMLSRLKLWFPLVRGRVLGLLAPVGMGFGILTLVFSGLVMSFVLRYVPTTTALQKTLEQAVPVLGAFVLFFMVYRVMPNPPPRQRTAAVAALLAALVWEAMRLGLPKFLPRIEVYEVLYGPLAGFLLVLIGFYLTMWIMLSGAVVARALEGEHVPAEAADVLE